MRQILIPCLLAIGFRVCAQADGMGSEYDDLAESVMSFSNPDVSLDDLIEHYGHLSRNPLNLNDAGPVDLQSLYLLSQEQVIHFLRYREETGSLLSPYELYFIESFDTATVERILPFVVIDRARLQRDTLSICKNLITTSRHAVWLRCAGLLESRQGFLNKRDPGRIIDGNYYLGAPVQLYGRIEIDEPHDFRMGLTFENDPGEPVFFSTSRHYYGFDHLAGFLQLENRGAIKVMILGDYKLQWGQGLVAGRGLFNSKGSAAVSSVKSSASGLRPYQGSSEYGYLRGISLQTGTKRFLLTACLSGKRRDVSWETPGNPSELPGISSFLNSGYHRTPAELLGRGAVMETVGGASLAYTSNTKRLNIGLTGMAINWDHAVSKGNKYYQPHRFAGKNVYLGSLYYDHYKGKYNLFGEISLSGNMEYAFIQGGMFNLSSSVESSLLIRYYSAGYFAPFSSSFGEYSGTENESGIYWGLRLRPLPRITVDAYFDLFKPLWLRYNSFSMAPGYEYMIKVMALSGKYASVAIQFREQTKERNLDELSAMVYRTLPGTKRQINVHYRRGKETGIYFQSSFRASMFTWGSSKTYGVAAAQDIGYKMARSEVNIRLAGFHTMDYENRQFFYEKDLFMYFAIPAYSGKGFRFYVMLKHRFSNWLDIWLKGGMFLYPGISDQGSGLNLISGNKKTEIRCQVRIKF